MKTALLIDDERVVRALIAQILKPDGWRVLEAADGEAGLSLALQHRPDLIVCDLLMPRGNGFQVCRAVRQRPELQHTRIIITTGRGYDSDRKNALEAGAHAYVTKPINLQQFGLTLSQVLAPAMPVSASSFASARSSEPVRLRFWGVRGSIPSPGPTTLHYGGNTSCVEVRADGQLIVLDAGTGIRLLGLALAAEFSGRPIELTVLITHTHWDHIQGFPFFEPAYDPKNQVRILGFEGARQGLETTLSSQMESPFFPIGLNQMPGSIRIEEQKDLKFGIGLVTVDAMFVNHPGICMGYRLQTSRGSIAYLPDNEPFQRLHAQPGSTTPLSAADMDFARAQDGQLIDFIRGVDVLIMDAQYDAAEYAAHVGWGHGCVDDVVALALTAGVKKLFLFHHDPTHDDQKISQMVASARAWVAAQGGTLEVEAAREGLEVVMEVAPTAGGTPVR